MYKDKDKQREANRQAQARFKAKGITSEGITDTKRVIPNRGVTEENIEDARKAMGVAKTDKAKHKGVTDADREQIEKDMVAIGLKPVRTAQGNIRVSKPGDDDYVPMCETTRSFIESRDKRPESGKRGKDIKCFGDLPMDVQEAIKITSTTNGKIDQAEKDRRTGIAIKYEHQFPDNVSPSWIPAIVSVSAM